MGVYSRRKSWETKVGNVVIGGDAPIRVQSMTTTQTTDTDGSVEQAGGGWRREGDGGGRGWRRMGMEEGGDGGGWGWRREGDRGGQGT